MYGEQLAQCLGTRKMLHKKQQTRGIIFTVFYSTHESFSQICLKWECLKFQIEKIGKPAQISLEQNITFTHHPLHTTHIPLFPLSKTLPIMSDLWAFLLSPKLPKQKEASPLHLRCLSLCLDIIQPRTLKSSRCRAGFSRTQARSHSRWYTARGHIMRVTTEKSGKQW